MLGTETIALLRGGFDAAIWKLGSQDRVYHRAAAPGEAGRSLPLLPAQPVRHHPAGVGVAVGAATTGKQCSKDWQPLLLEQPNWPTQTICPVLGLARHVSPAGQSALVVQVSPAV